MKRIWCFALTALLLLGMLAGCGTSKPEASSQPSGESQGASSTPVESQPDESLVQSEPIEEDISGETTTDVTSSEIDNTSTDEETPSTSATSSKKTDTKTSSTNSRQTTTKRRTVMSSSTTNGKTSATTTAKTTAKTTATTTSTQAIASFPALANTKYMLTKKNELTVAFLGGSITAGYGTTSEENTWRRKTVKWLESQYPNAAIKEIKASAGGTGTYYGKTRVDQDVLVYNPDLIFIEFVVNDYNDGATALQSQRNMETIVRKCLTHNPNMDIVFVYTTDYARYGKANTWTMAFDKVAEHYDIEVIDVGAAIANSNKEFKSLFLDDLTHPNDAGHAVMFAEMQARMNEMLADAKTPTALQKHAVPSSLTNDLSINTKTYFADDIIAQNPTLINAGKQDYRPTYDSVRIDPGQSVTFTFTGDSIGVYWFAFDSASTPITCTIDNKTTTQKKVRRNSNGMCYAVFEDLKNAEHTFSFTYTGSTRMYLCQIFTTY